MQCEAVRFVGLLEKWIQFMLRSKITKVLKSIEFCFIKLYVITVKIDTNNKWLLTWLKIY